MDPDRHALARAAQRLRTGGWWLLAALPLIFLLLFYLYPLWSILQVSLLDDGRLDLTPLRTALTERPYLGVLWFSVWQALLSTALTLLAALPAAFLFARYEFRGKTLLRALASVPFVMPTVVVAVAFGALLGPRGLLNSMLQAALELEEPPIELAQTLAMVLIAHVFYNYTLVLRIVGGYWANLDPQLEQAAAVLGGSRWRVFRSVTLPLLMPALGAAALLIFIFTFSAFGTVLILGGPGKATIEVEIYTQALTFLNLPLAAALSLLQLVVTLIATAIYNRLQRRAAVPQQLRPQHAIQKPIRGLGPRLLQIGVVGSMSLLLIAPLAALVMRSLSLGEDPLASYVTLLTSGPTSFFPVPPSQAILNSLRYAGLTVGLSLLVGVPLSYLLARARGLRRAMLDALVMLPIGTSAVTLGLGYLIALSRPLTLPLLGDVSEPLRALRISPWLLPLAHTLIALPFVVRSLLPALGSIDPRLRESAAVLGASPLAVLREIDLPIMARGVAVAAIFAFTVSIGEFGASLLISRPDYPTIPVVIYRLLGLPGQRNYSQALAMSSLLLIVTTAGFMLIERLRIGKSEF